MRSAPPASPSRSPTGRSGGCSGSPAWHRCATPCARRTDLTRRAARLDHSDDPAASVVLALPAAPLTPIDRRQFDYSDLDHWMAEVDRAIRHVRRMLSTVAKPTQPEAELSNDPLDACPPA